MWVLLLSAVARAIPACVADDVCLPTADPCLVTANYEVGTGCTLDFGARAVVVSTGRLDALTGSATLRAGSLEIQSGGQFWAKDGGDWVVELTGPFTQNGSVDLTTAGAAGSLDVTAGAVSITSPIAANGRVRAAYGSSVTMQGSSVDIQSAIRTYSGSDAAGGPIWIDSGGELVVDATLDASGGWLWGGDITLRALGTVHQLSGTLNAAGGGDAGSGGIVYAWGVGGVTMEGSIDAHGSSGTYGSGGDGGVVGLSSPSGHVVCDAAIDVHSPADGTAGGVMLVADAGDIVLTKAINGGGTGSYATGGWVAVFADGTFDQGSNIDVSGGDGGGGQVFVSATTANLSANILAQGGGYSGYGGVIAIDADTVDVAGRLDPRADPNGFGGEVYVDACDLWVESTGWVANDRPGGDNQLIARESVTLDGDFDADVSNTLTYRRGTPVIGATASFAPARIDVFDAALRSCVCPLGDEDGDQVCDRDDRCPGGDDTVDLDGDGWPDACPLVHDVAPGVAGDWNLVTITGATPHGFVWLVGSFLPGPLDQPRCNGQFALDLPGRGRRFQADATGTVRVPFHLGTASAGQTGRSQVLDVESCRTDAVVLTPL